VHLVTHGHFRSCDKDGGHIIQLAVAENPMLAQCTQTTWLYVLWNQSYCWSKFYIVGLKIINLFGSCELDLYPITFIYEPDPYPLKIYRCAKWTSYIKTVESYRITN